MAKTIVDSKETARPKSERELIVIAKPEVGLRARQQGPASVAGSDVSSLAGALSAAGAKLRPLFGPSEEHIAARTAAAPGADDDAPLARYYRVEAHDRELDTLAQKLQQDPAIEAAYVKPAAEPALYQTMLPRDEEPPAVTPNFESRQGYLGAAPAGIDARHAWTVAGGSGTGVRIIDVEGAWRFTHEDLGQVQGGVVGGTPTDDPGWLNHGTAVIGEFSGDRNPFGVTGICPDANVRAISIFGLGSAPAIQRAADVLSPGDVILIELHRAGPDASGAGQDGYIAMEWWPDDYEAIRYATARGVIVVEAAGNGARNLDAAVFDTPGAGFPASWKNPFRRGARDSGAILVGAGAPPPGTHGRDHGPDRSRLDFSNFGSAVDAQGWGREVTTAGYGDLQGGASEDVWYTDQFSGTSSASPIVVGALGCVQGARRARGLALLTPARARSALRTYGTPQADAPSRPATQRIGMRPDLRKMFGALVTTATVPLHRYWNPTNTDHFYTTDYRELGGGAHGWNYEGVQCAIQARPVAGAVPLHRYWNAGIGDHFYTTNFAELGGGAHGWGYEGIQGYVWSTARPGTRPLYRYWNAGIGDHFYTTNFAELGSGAHGWGYEGVQCYVDSWGGTPLALSPDEAEPDLDMPQHEPADDLAPRTEFGGAPSATSSFASLAAPATGSFAAKATNAVPASFQTTGSSSTPFEIRIAITPKS